MTNYTWQHQDLIEGAELQLTSNADQSRTFVFIAMHENKLYILDGTVPKGYPQPGLFQQSMGFVDKDGRGIRYRTMYSNEIYGLKEAPTPSYGGGGGAPGQGAGRRRTPWRRRRQRAAAALDQITHARGRAARTPRPRS